MSAQQIDVHGLPLKWHGRCDCVHCVRCAEELEAALRQSGDWIAADDVRRLVRELDVALNGEAGAAPKASLCDIVGQVQAEARRRGAPLLAALRQSGGAVYQLEYEGGWRDTDKPTFDWWVQQGSRKCRVLYTALPATSGLVEALRKAYADGWHECAEWAERADLHSDVDSPAYEEARERWLKRHIAALAAHDARGGK